MRRIAAAQLRIALSNWYTTAGAGLDRAYTGLVENLAKAMERPTSLAYTVAAVWASSRSAEFDEAFTVIDKAQALAPNDPEVLVEQGSHPQRDGPGGGGGGASFGSPCASTPASRRATLRTLSMSLFHQERYQEAIDAVERIKAQGADDDQRLHHAGLESRPTRPHRRRHRSDRPL